MTRWWIVIGTLLSCSSFSQELPASVRVGSQLKALIFLSPDCPISQKYMKKLEDLKNQFEGKVEFLAVFPDPASMQTIKKFKKRIPFNLGIRE